MNSDQLVKFKAIAEHRTLTEAAESLYVTQPALSHSLSQLEKELQCKLFDREKGKLLTLTTEGTKLLEYANSITEMIEEAHLAMCKDKSIVIPAINFVTAFVLKELEKEEFANIKLANISEKDMPEMLYKGEIDCAICDDLYFNRFFASKKGLPIPHKTIVCLEQLALLVREGDEFYDKRNITYLECGNRPMIIQSSASTLNEWIEKVKDICNYEFNKAFSIDYYSFNILRDSLDYPQVIVLNSIVDPLQRIISKYKHRVVPINDIYSKRTIYLWYLEGNEKKIEPLLTSLKKYYYSPQEKVSKK